jgi:hypothetical protein
LGRFLRKKAAPKPSKKVEITALSVAAAAHAKRSFTEVWLITIGHSLTHWYPATFYLRLPLIGNELGLSYVQIGSILTAQIVMSSMAVTAVMSVGSGTGPIVCGLAGEMTQSASS